MTYDELFNKALQGRSVNQAAKDWGIPQSTADKYKKGKHLPDYQTAKKIAMDAGVTQSEVMDIFAEYEATKKPRGAVVETGYAAASIFVSVNLSLTHAPAKAAPIIEVRNRTLRVMLRRQRCLLRQIAARILIAGIRAVERYTDHTTRPTVA